MLASLARSGCWKQLLGVKGGETVPAGSWYVCSPLCALQFAAFRHASSALGCRGGPYGIRKAANRSFSGFETTFFFENVLLKTNAILAFAASTLFRLFRG
jgi:hypothetical protein